MKELDDVYTSPRNQEEYPLIPWVIRLPIPSLLSPSSLHHHRRHLSLPPRCTRRRKHIELFLSCWYDHSISFRLLTPISDLSDTHTELGRSFAAFCNSGALDDFLYYPSDLLLASNPLSCLTLSTFIYSRSPPLDLVPECTHQTYSTFHVTPNHAGLQILLQ